MAGERVPPDDDLVSDDDFILDDWDEELDIVGQVEAEVEQQLEVISDEPQARAAPSSADDSFSEQATQFAPGWGDLGSPVDAEADVEDVLFAGGAAETTAGSSFDSQGASTWEGANATPQEMGLPVSGADEVQEIELGDDEESADFSDDSRFFGERAIAPRSLSQIRSRAPVPAASDSADPGHQFEDTQTDGGYSSQLKELGAPEDADWEEEEYAEDQATAEVGDAGEYEEYEDDGEPYAADGYADDDQVEEDHGDVEVAYAAPVPVAGGFIGGRQRRRGVGLRRAVAAAAAVLVVGLAAAVVVLKPEWLGVVPHATLVDRTEVVRPQVVALTIAPPQAEFPDEIAPPIDPVAGGSETTDPIVTPLPEPVPVGGDPDLGPVVESPDPLLVVDPKPSGETQPEDPPQSPVDGLVAVGDELRIGGRVEPDPPGLRAAVHPMAADLIAGSQAVVKLQNGNYFIGRVNKFDAVNLTLRLTNGEIKLPFDRVVGLASLSESEVKSLETGKNGFVRLRNRNRLFGSIEELGLIDHVVLSNGGNRVIIPREAIEEIGKARADGVQMTDDLDDAWVRQMIEQRLEQQRQTEAGEEPGKVKGQPR